MKPVIPEMDQCLRIVEQVLHQISTAPETPPYASGPEIITWLLESVENPDYAGRLAVPALQALLAHLQPMLSAADPCPGLLMIGHIHEHIRGLQTAGTGNAGRVYTPYGLARRMARELLAGWTPNSDLTPHSLELPRLLDTACGCGAFLITAAEEMYQRCTACSGSQLSPAQMKRLRLRIIREAIHGCDTDPAALDLCRTLLHVWATGSSKAGPGNLHLVQGDALSGISPSVSVAFTTNPAGIDWNTDSLLGLQGRGYDYIIGNPPYIDSVGMGSDSRVFRKHIRGHYETARGNWDLFVPFLERSLDLLAPAGQLCLVVPVRALCADYAAALQQLLLRQRILSIRLQDPHSFPGAHVWTVAILVEKAGSSGLDQQVRLQLAEPQSERIVSQNVLRRMPQGYIAGAFSQAAGYIAKLLETCPALGEFMQCGDGCSTAEAYRIRELLQDDATASGPQLLNTGTIDPYRALWGTRPCRYLGTKLLHPVADAAQLQSELPRRAAQSLLPKLLVAGLANRIECLVDQDGRYLCGKAAVQLLPRDDNTDLQFFCGLLNSSLLNWLYRSLFGLRAFSSRALNIGPRQLELLPIVRGKQETRIAELSRELHVLAARGESDALHSTQQREIDRLVLEMYRADSGLRRLIEAES